MEPKGGAALPISPSLVAIITAMKQEEGTDRSETKDGKAARYVFLSNLFSFNYIFERLCHKNP